MDKENKNKNEFKMITEEEIVKGDDVLVFAPHNDDEILGTGGVLQRYVESAAQVKVAIVTNGDGQIRRPPFVPFFRPDFVKLGYRRQNESLDALEYLGIGESSVEFLGYPDRGLSKMWTRNWDENDLYYSKYTKSDHSPYHNSYTKKAPYCGRAVVEDVKDLILEVEPDVIYTPHPNDAHPDHWATNGFVLYGLEAAKNQNPEALKDVTALSYLVHNVKFPYPRGKYLEASMSKPANLKDLDTEWYDIPLKFRERLRKFQAIGKYRTQNQLMRKYLISFARANELFGVVPELSLNHSTRYDATPNLSRDFTLNEEADKFLLSYLNPKRRSRIAALKRYPDIESVGVTKESNILKVMVDFYNRYRKGNEIQITLKPLTAGLKNPETGSSHRFNFRNGKLYRDGTEIGKDEGYNYNSGGKCYSLSVPLEKISDPEKTILSITLARKGGPFARSANRLIELN